LVRAPDDVSAFVYGGPLQVAVQHAKFGPDESTARALARLWVHHLRAGTLPPMPDVDLVTWVPVPLRRLLRRGFDMPALLAAALARSLGKPWVDVLDVTRGDAPLSQGADKAARHARVQGRYRVRCDVRGKRVLLIDDVRTTGATLDEAARVLSEAGAEVVVRALAQTP
jgi:ComF family protein